MKNNIEIYLFPLAVISMVLLVLLAYFLWRVKKELLSKDKRIEEKDEKIKWLRQTAAENEHRYTKKDYEIQKQILELNHTITLLETQAKEGTKNQVVSKIEALQSKREKQLECADLVL